MDRAQLADFLRTRRESLQPEDVGLPRGPRRRTSGLRREEVAALCGMSSDYYGRLEQQRGPQPSEQMLAAIARGLRLSLDERDHLFRLGGHNTPARAHAADQVSQGMLRIMDRLQDTAAVVMNGLGETLLQTPMAVALLGDQMSAEGDERFHDWQWFVTGTGRRIYPEEDHATHGRTFAADLRRAMSLEGTDGRVHALVDRLLEASAEFRTIWSEHAVGAAPSRSKRLVHPELGELRLDCQVLTDLDQSQVLLVFTPTAGAGSEDSYRLLRSLGARSVDA